MPPPPLKSEHLLWEPRFRNRLLLSLAACAAVAFGASQSPRAWVLTAQIQSALSSPLMTLSHRYEWWSFLGLLSSSCCVLQLALNMLSIGCAGFNTILGPIRPQMIAITLTLQAFMWQTVLLTHGQPRLRVPISTSLVTATLM